MEIRPVATTWPPFGGDRAFLLPSIYVPVLRCTATLQENWHGMQQAKNVVKSMKFTRKETSVAIVHVGNREEGQFHCKMRSFIDADPMRQTFWCETCSHFPDFSRWLARIKRVGNTTAEVSDVSCKAHDAQGRLWRPRNRWNACFLRWFFRRCVAVFFCLRLIRLWWPWFSRHTFSGWFPIYI